MTIKAVYTFTDGCNEYHVYKHFDGSPRSAAHFINCATSVSWKLPKFEAGEFASAFIAANKCSAGDIFLAKHYNNYHDLSYRYEVFPFKSTLCIKVYEKVENSHSEYKLLYNGCLRHFIKQCAYTIYV